MTVFQEETSMNRLLKEDMLFDIQYFTSATTLHRLFLSKRKKNPPPNNLPYVLSPLLL